MTSITNNAFEAVKTAANHDEQVKALNVLKVTELRELAKWQSIRLTGKTRKADIIEAVIDGMRQNVIHFMENAMLGTRKSLNITRENLNENLNSAYLDNGYSFTPETIKTFAKAFYNIELGQGDALDLAREFLTKINSKIFKLVAHFDELDEAEAVVSKFENKQELINLVNEFKTLNDEKKMRRLLNSLSAQDVRRFARETNTIVGMGITRKADVIDTIIELVHARQADTDEAKADEVPEQGNAKEAEAEDEPEDSLKAQFLADCFKDDLKACTKLSEVMKVINEFKLTAENFVELVSPDVEIKLAGGALNAAVQYCEAFNLELDNSKELYEQKLGDLFDELVPSSGKAGSVAGELVRAASRIAYRYYNDGDLLGVGYGRETVNPAGRFLRAYGNESIRHCVEHLWGALEDRDYKFYLHWLIQLVVDKVEFEPELKNMECESMEDWRDVAQDIDDEEFEYDDDRVMLIEKFLKAKAAKLKAKRKAENNDDDDPDDDPNNNAMRKPEAEAEDEDGQASAEFMAKIDELDQKGGDAPRSQSSEHKADVLNKSADELQKILKIKLDLD